MSTDAVTPLRHRMIEDMNARKLSVGTQRGHIHRQAVCCISQSLSRHGDDRRYSPVPVALGRG